MMDDSNNQDNKTTNSSPVPLHPLFSVFEKNLIKAGVSPRSPDGGRGGLTAEL